jgi:hypothetical protein
VDGTNRTGVSRSVCRRDDGSSAAHAGSGDSCIANSGHAHCTPRAVKTCRSVTNCNARSHSPIFPS